MLCSPSELVPAPSTPPSVFPTTRRGVLLFSAPHCLVILLLGSPGHSPNRDRGEEAAGGQPHGWERGPFPTALCDGKRPLTAFLPLGPGRSSVPLFLHPYLGRGCAPDVSFHPDSGQRPSPQHIHTGGPGTSCCQAQGGWRIPPVLAPVSLHSSFHLEPPFSSYHLDG